MDLLETDTFRGLSARPKLLRTTFKKDDRMIFGDEIQELPSLLHVVHLLSEATILVINTSVSSARSTSQAIFAGSVRELRASRLVQE